jgi:FMN phosphatase YigB (HAD superfamily)
VLALIDFGNTLAEETFMRRDSESFPTWTSTWLRTMTKTRLDWDTGRLSTDELADVIAAEVGCRAEAVRGYMSQLCRRVDFYPTINAALRRRRARGGRQALVTVNPDLFEEVVSHYSLLDSFDAVITSSSQGTHDKVELCWRALELMGVDDPSDTVLIDNLQVNIDGWVTAGGKGYLFVEDDGFADDVARGKVPGFEARDLVIGGEQGQAGG